jgi:hypothetical protein
VFLLLVWFAPLIIFDIDLTLGGVVSKRWRLCSERTAVWKVSGEPLEIKKSYFVVYLKCSLTSFYHILVSLLMQDGHTTLLLLKE